MNAVSSRVLDEAIAWQLCLGSGEATAQDRQHFSHWHDAQPEHAQVWQQLGGLDQQLAAATPMPARRALLRGDHESKRRVRRIGGSLLGLAVAVAVSLGLMSQQRPLSDYLADQMTGSGEQLSMTLPDNSQLHLNSRSAVDIDFAGAERRLFLRSGEILVQTAHGDPRPFVVDTDQGRLRALGTRFLVRREGNGTRLIVLQSAVAARPARLDNEQVVPAGKQVLMSASGLGDTHAAPSAADAWSHGMLVVENVRLADLVEQLGEYRHGYLGVDPSLADLRISGSFPLNDSNLALAALPPSLPVRIEKHTDWWVRLVPLKQ
ncbi:FecR family protein [Pseudomonas sp. LRF_L74]|uniref:FecR family protein n=1 Tax=Pseudomonas sp. LRF_L74 TaxID=3369422 RepID=UPI003F613495